MTTPHGSRLSRFTTLAAALTVLAACSDQASNDITNPDASSPTVNLLITPSPSQVVVPGATPGSFQGYAPNAVGRTTSQFFSNVSADENTLTPQCNVGFYAGNAWTAANCINFFGQLPTEAYPSFYGVGRAPASFRFSGAFTYDVKLRAVVHGRESMRVGWFEVSNAGAYVFHPIVAYPTPEDTAQITTITTDGRPWGFYVTNDINGEDGGCDSPNTDCSDASGGFEAKPFQQFALFKNGSDTRYLVGVEDNGINPLTGSRDADYQDYIFTVTPYTVCDFITFGRLVTEVGGNKVVISGNAGGNAPGGGIMGEFHITVNGTDYHVANVATYGAITNGALFGLTNSRIVTGTAKNGASVELRLWDGGEPGKDTDRVYVKINGVEYLGAAGKTIDQGNMQYHGNCRGPG